MKNFKIYQLALTAMLSIMPGILYSQCYIAGVVKSGINGEPVTEGTIIYIGGTNISTPVVTATTGSGGDYLTYFQYIPADGFITITGPVNSKTIYAESGRTYHINFWDNASEDFDGNRYSAVEIGRMIWLGENLKTTHFSDGSGISNITDNIEWADYNSPAYSWYNNDVTNKGKYGALYNWFAVRDSKGICPTGWHVPSDIAWTALSQELGGDLVSGGKLKQIGTENWIAPNTGATDEIGFSALPGGSRPSDFSDLGIFGRWWSSTIDLNFPIWTRTISYNNAQIGRYLLDPFQGMSVRCIKDGFQTILYTTPANNITHNSAETGGKSIEDGGNAVIGKGVCWSTNHNPTILADHTECGTGNSDFTCQITGLAANTTYYIRSYITTSLETSYAVEKSFKTASEIYPDSLALVALYNSTNGPEWTNHTNWLVPGQPVSAWFGVSVSMGRVTAINLYLNNLSGELPVELGNLKDLEMLDLNQNSLTGPLPQELFNLANLKALIFYANQLTGTIPTNIGNLSKATHIDFSNNNLTGNIPESLGEITNLYYLDLGSNNLSGAIPLSIFSCQILHGLSLHDNELSGSIPTEIGNLINLNQLNLENNQLTGNIPNSIGDLEAIRLLNFGNNVLEGELPSELWNLISLEALDLQSNNFNGGISGDIGKLNYLQILYLSDNQFSGIIPNEIYSLVKLNFVRLNKNQLTGAINSEVGNLTELQMLDLSQNQLSGDVPVEIANLTKLRWLYFSDNQFTSFPEVRESLLNLEYLTIYNNYLNFRDIEPNIGVTPFTYAPQADIEVIGEHTVPLGKELKLTVDAGGTSSVYQWYKDGNPVGSSSSTYIISSAALSDAGTYSCTVTNTVATALTLQSVDAIVDVNVPPGMVATTNDSGYGSLREAMLYANTHPGMDTIKFALPGAGPYIIKPLTLLPELTGPVFIDGFSQVHSGEPMKPVIELDGSEIPESSVGLTTRGDQSIIRGLIINRFYVGISIRSDNNKIYGNYLGTDQEGASAGIDWMNIGIGLSYSSGNQIGGSSLFERNIITVSGGNIPTGILIRSGSTNTITGNYIGVDVTGRNKIGATHFGISLQNSNNNKIGGSVPGDRNIISGCFMGIYISSSNFNFVQGNYIGTNSGGTIAIGNSSVGIGISGGLHNVIGGINSGEGNLISGNRTGILMGVIEDYDFRECSYNYVKGNLIGTDFSGKNPLGNDVGVLLADMASNNIVGGNEKGASNLITNSIRWGVIINGYQPDKADPVRNAVSCNSIYNNGRIGIDLCTTDYFEGVTQNDPMDIDEGPNGNQNFPVLENIKLDLGNKTVAINGYLESAPSKEYTIEFFANKISDNTGYGEGQNYLGFIKVNTDVSGRAEFIATLPIQSSWGDVISATATDQDGNTSEFSANVGGFQTQKIPSWPFYYKINADGVQRISDGSDITAINNAFNAWESITAAVINFENGGIVNDKYASAIDGNNLVTFVDDHFPFAPGVIAVAAKTLEILPGSTEARILDADIVVNPEFARNLLGVSSGAVNETFYDIQSLITHEIGHVLGLLHSGVAGSTMFYSLDPGSSKRSLEQDDKSWASYRYPAATFSTEYGSISGNIKYGYNISQPVAGALVIASNTRTGEKIHGYSDANGNYIIPGLNQDSYSIHIAPLDGSDAVYNLKPGNISAYLYSNTVYTDYPGEFFSSPEDDLDLDSDISPVAVTPGGGITGIDLTTNRDITGPTVISVLPSDNATGVSINEDFFVTFSEPVGINSFNEATCYIESSGVKHPVVFTAVRNTNSIVVSPEMPLEYLTLYTLHLTSGIKDLKNNSLIVAEGEMSIDVTTIVADLDPPVITGISPVADADSIFVTSGVTVIFSEPMNRLSVESNFLIANDADSPVKVDGSFTWDNENIAFTFKPYGSLEEGTTYHFTVKSEASDLGNVAMGETKTYSFTTIPSASPEIVDFGPTDGETKVAVTTCIFVDFSEPVDIATVNENTFSVNGSGVNVKGSYEFLNQNSRIVFRPENLLSFSTSYSVALTSGITDASADAFGGKTFGFTTAAVVQTPHIYYIDPPAGAVGSVITIAGNGFDPDPVNNKVSFNGIIAGVKSATLTSVVAEIPAGAISGSVTVTSSNIQSDNSMFFYVVPQSLDPCENIVANVPTGTSTKDVEVMADASYAFITNPGENTVTVINLEDPLNPYKAGIVDVGTTPLKIDLNPQGTRAYVTNFNSHTVSVIDITEPAKAFVVKTINVGITPYGIAVTPDGMGVYVSNYLTGNLSLIDADPSSGGYDHVVANVPTGTKPTEVEVSADAGTVVVIDESGLTIINSNPSDPGYNSVVANVPTGTKPTDVAVTADASLAVVSTEDGRLLLIALKPENEDYSNAIVANVQTGTKVSDVTISADAMFVYATATYENKILVYRLTLGGTSVINGSYTGNFNLEYHDEISVGNMPEGLVISSDATMLFVLSDYISGEERELVSIKLCCGPVDPANSIGDLIITIQNLINTGTITEAKGKELISFLNGAISYLSVDKTKDAINKLNTYINKVGDLVKSNKLAPDIGQQLINPANTIILQLKGTKSGLNDEADSVELQKEIERLSDYGQMAVFPNPFTESVTIELEISDNEEPVKAMLRIYSASGNLIRTLFEGTLSGGMHSFVWDGSNKTGQRASSGSYLIYFRAGSTELVRMVILAK
jgi:uncharacterized protein (TIGR02145 family)